MSNRTKRPEAHEVEQFNRRYDNIITLKKDIEKKRKDIVREAIVIDKLADGLFWDANNEDHGMFYNDKNGMLKCVNRDVCKKIDIIDQLRSYSLDI